MVRPSRFGKICGWSVDRLGVAPRRSSVSEIRCYLVRLSETDTAILSRLLRLLRDIASLGETRLQSWLGCVGCGLKPIEGFDNLVVVSRQYKFQIDKHFVPLSDTQY